VDPVQKLRRTNKMVTRYINIYVDWTRIKDDFKSLFSKFRSKKEEIRIEVKKDVAKVKKEIRKDASAIKAGVKKYAVVSGIKIPKKSK
jgi:hypothetical protein